MARALLPKGHHHGDFGANDGGNELSVIEDVSSLVLFEKGHHQRMVLPGPRGLVAESRREANVLVPQLSDGGLKFGRLARHGVYGLPEGGRAE